MPFRVISFYGGLGHLALFENGYSRKWAGGVRIKKYASNSCAKEEAKELASCMESKNRKALIGSFGGCKTCININPRDEEAREQALRCLAIVLEDLDGKVLIGGDLNCGGKDLLFVKSLLPPGGPALRSVPELFGKEIATATGYGIFGGILATCAKSVAVQGVGAVGSTVINLLLKRGISVAAFDINPDSRGFVSETSQFTWCTSMKELLSYDAELFCPCADGHVLTRDLVDTLACSDHAKYILGAANHQLDEDSIAAYMEAKGLVWFPDCRKYLICLIGSRFAVMLTRMGFVFFFVLNHAVNIVGMEWSSCKLRRRSEGNIVLR